MVAASVATAEEPKMVPQQADILCGNTLEVLDAIKEGYGEDLLFIGGDGDIEENVFTSLWVNEETGTWSIIVTNKKELVSCLVVTGEMFQHFKPQIGI